MPILSRSEFEQKLKQLGYVPETWAKMTLKQTLDAVYADYFKSGKDFDEWLALNEDDGLAKVGDVPCPKCGNHMILQAHYEHAINEEIFQCAGCLKWFSESGKIEDEEGEWVKCESKLP